MGTDIHAHIETRDRDGTWWHTASGDLGIDRWYDLFAAMADVRNSYERGIVPVSQPRGLPDDVSGVVAMDYDRWSEDAHSASWLTTEEFSEAILRAETASNLASGETNVGFPNCPALAMMRSIASNTQDPRRARLVFWFDN